MPSADVDRGRTQALERLPQLLRDDSNQGLLLWCETFAKSLLADDVGIVERLVSEPLDLPPDFARLVDSSFRPAIDDLRDARLSQALQRLTVGAGEIGQRLSAAVAEARAAQGAQSDLRDAVVQGLSAMWLEAGGQSRGAAVPYFEAGKRFGWLGDAYASLSIDLLTRANELDPSYVPTYWHLANARFVRSFAEPSAVEEALAIWNRGARIKLPDASSSWAFVLRALMGDQLARIDDARRIASWWEAIIFLERALLLYSDDASRWAYLGRFHRMLENEATCLHVTGRSLQQDPNDLAALEERAAILANTGAFDEALAHIDQRLATDPGNVWAKGVKVYILMYQGACQPALAIINEVIAADPDSLWNVDVRASCHRLLGDREAARAAYARILEMGASRPEMTSDDARTCAIAAYRLQDIDRAVALLEKTFPDPVARDDTMRLLGLCLLARGRVGRAEELLIGGVVRGNARELQELISVELPEFESLHRGALDVPGVVPAIARVKRTSAALIADLKRNSGGDARDEATTELTLLLRADHSPAVQPYADVAIRAGLARLQVESGAWLAAAATYQSLQRLAETFPEASAGVERAVAGLRKAANHHVEQRQYDEAVQLLRGLLDVESEASDPGKRAVILQEIGDTLWAAEKVDDALAEFEKALALTGEPALASRRAGLQSRVALVHLRLGHPERVRASVRKAVQAYAESGAENPWLAFASTRRPLIRDVGHFWQVDATWADLASDPSNDEATTRQIAAARASTLAYLDGIFQLSAAAEGIPVVTPIALEVGSAIVPLLDPKMDEGTFIYKAIPAMRERIKAATLVQTPGITVREDPARQDEYVILLDGAPVARGAVKVAFRYGLSSPAVPHEIASSGEGVVDARDPVTGKAGSWFPKQHWETLATSGVELQTETEFILRHVEHVLRLNLHQFLGVQEAVALVQRLAKTEAAFGAAAVTDPDARLLFARGLRALVREGVPLTDWPAIVAGLTPLGTATVDAMVRQARLSVKAELPGNQTGTTLIQLAEEWKAPVSPLEAHRLLSTIRRRLESSTGPLALVTASDRLRPIVRRLIEYEFPGVSVLARDEVLQPDLVEPFDRAGAVADARGSLT